MVYPLNGTEPLSSNRGRPPPPEAMMPFPHGFRFPSVFEQFFWLRGKFYLSQQIFRFSSAKISDDLPFSHWLNFEFAPLFSLFQYISPYFGKIIIPPTYANFPWFRKIYVFFTYFIYFSFPPYFDDVAFMYHTMHVVDAPAFEHIILFYLFFRRFLFHLECHASSCLITCWQIQTLFDLVCILNYCRDRMCVCIQ